ncbi:MAG: helix-turn-helix domain-containing protein [Chloroflexales bacterium]|nr:helix-turn-helix domain-containing protein [Chloroflexales bacterium]
MQTIDGEEYLDVEEATAQLRVKKATLYAYVSRGVLHSYRQGVGRQRLYKRSEVEALLAVRPSAQQEQGRGGALPYADSWAGDH